MGKRFRFLLSILVALFLIGGAPSVAQATEQPEPNDMAVYLNGDFSRSGSANIVGDLYTANGNLTFIGSAPAFTGTFYHITGTAFNYPIDDPNFSGFDSKSQELDVTSFNAEFPDLADFPTLPDKGSLTSQGGQGQTISEDGHYSTLTVGNKTITIDVSDKDLHIVIDTLTQSSWNGVVNITGNNTLYLYINNFSLDQPLVINNLSQNPENLYIVSKKVLSINTSNRLYGNLIYQGIDSIARVGTQSFSNITGSLITDASLITLDTVDHLYGLLYAPNAAVNMSSDNSVTGRLVANTLSMIGNNVITYHSANSTLNLPAALLAPEPETYTVNVAVDPAGSGTVTPTYAEVEEGQSIHIQATPNAGYEFTHFTSTDNSMVPDGAGNVTVTGDVTITAHFQEIVIDNGYMNGILGEYYDEAELQNSSALRLRRIDPSVNFNFGYDAPDSSMEPETFSIRWTGYIKPSVSGNYTFKTYSDDGVRVFIDGEKIIDTWGLLSLDFSIGESPVSLEAGTYYPITVEYQQLPLYAGVFLFWESDYVPMGLIPEANYFISQETYDLYSTPQYPNPLDKSGQGFRNLFYEVDQNENISSTPGYETLGQVYYEWGAGAPAGISTDAFYGVLEGTIETKFTEDITFLFEVDDSIKVWLDDVLVIDQWGWNSREIFTHTFSAVAGGKYDVRIEYIERGIGATLIMSWFGDSLEGEIIPASYMYPPIE